ESKIYMELSGTAKKLGARSLQSTRLNGYLFAHNSDYQIQASSLSWAKAILEPNGDFELIGEATALVNDNGMHVGIAFSKTGSINSFEITDASSGISLVGGVDAPGDANLELAPALSQ